MKMFFLSSFLPRVSVCATSDADDAVKRVGLEGVSDLLRPFGTTEKVQPRDSHGNTIPVDSFQIRFTNLPSVEEINLEPVAGAFSDAMRNELLSSPSTSLNLNDMKDRVNKVDLEKQSPWFAEYRKWFFKFFGASEHETFNHPICRMDGYKCP